MFKRIKDFLEGVAYAGLKPSGGRPLAQAEEKKPGRFAPLQEKLRKLINGPATNDPLYLSNRTFMQKARLWLVLGVPAGVLLGVLGLILIGYFNHDAGVAPPPAGLSNAEIAEKMLPDLNKPLIVDSQHDVDVEDVHVLNAPVKLAGLAVNKTDHAIAHVEIVFELTDKTGSRQGAVSTKLTNLPANATVPFTFPIEQQTASFALVREIRVH